MNGNKDLVFDYGIPHHFFGVPDNAKEIKEAERLRKMKIKVEESIKLDDGKHEGTIEDIQYREKPYSYTDIVLNTKVKGKDVKIKVSFPTNITENSALGLLLIRFGAKLAVGKDIEPEEFLTKGLNVEFQTITKGKYYEVIKESLKKA